MTTGSSRSSTGTARSAGGRTAGRPLGGGCRPTAPRSRCGHAGVPIGRFVLKAPLAVPYSAEQLAQAVALVDQAGAGLARSTRERLGSPGRRPDGDPRHRRGDGAEPPVVVHPLPARRRRSRPVRATKFHHMTIGSLERRAADEQRGRVAPRRPARRSSRPGAEVGEVAGHDAGAVDGHRALEDHEGVLVRRRRAGSVGAPAARPSSAPTWSVSRRAGEAAPSSSPTSTVAVAGVQLDAGQLGVVLEGGVAVAGGLGLGDPELDRRGASPR